MKRKIISASLFIISAIATAQIKVIENESKPEFIGGILPMKRHKVELTKQDSNYCLSYIDTKFKGSYEYKKICFEDVDNSFLNLYNTINRGFEDMPKNPIVISFPSGRVEFKFSSNLGIPNVEFFHHLSSNNVGTSVVISKSRWRQLFGMEKS